MYHIAKMQVKLDSLHCKLKLLQKKYYKWYLYKSNYFMLW